MACTTGTLDDPETLSIFRAHGAARPEAAVFAKGIHPACGERMAREQPGLHFLYREVDALSHGLDKDAVRKKLIAMRTTPRAAVAALRAPLLCVTGEEDVVIPPAAVAILASIVPGARLARVPEAGHSVYWERPDAFNHLVDGFLRDAAALTQGRAPLRHDAPPAGARRPRPGRGRRARPAPARRRERRALPARPGTSLARGHAPDRRGDLVRRSAGAVRCGGARAAARASSRSSRARASPSRSARHSSSGRSAPEPLAAVAVTMPPWPGPDEAVRVPGTWPSDQAPG